MTVAFDSYLRAKRTVDDSAIDRRLHDVFRGRLADRADTAEGPLRILEVGAGIGTMPARLLEWGTLPAGRIRYAAVDVDPDAAAGIEPYLHEWAAGRQISVSGTDPIVLADDIRTVEIERHAVTPASETAAPSSRRTRAVVSDQSGCRSYRRLAA